MSCPMCKGKGFILNLGDFRHQSGIVSKELEYVARCPEYKRYFDELPSLANKPIWDSRLCDYAVKTHNQIFEHRRNKEEKASKRY